MSGKYRNVIELKSTNVLTSTMSNPILRHFHVNHQYGCQSCSVESSTHHILHAQWEECIQGACEGYLSLPGRPEIESV